MQQRDSPPEPRTFRNSKFFNPTLSSGDSSTGKDKNIRNILNAAPLLFVAKRDYI